MAVTATGRPHKAAQFHDRVFYVLSEEDELRLKKLFEAMQAVQLLCAGPDGDFDQHAASPLLWHFADAGQRIVAGCRLYGDQPEGRA